jgi:hypothetical protein
LHQGGFGLGFKLFVRFNEGVRYARIYGTRTPLPDGRDSRTYLAHLQELETQTKAARRGAWAKSQP